MSTGVPAGRVRPQGGENVQLVDRKTVPQLEAIPTDYVVRGVEVDPSKLPLPLTLQQVEARTAMVTGIRPLLPAALEMEESLRLQRVDYEWEAKDGRPSSATRSPQGRPQSSGPATDYTSVMVQAMCVDHVRLASRGDSRAEARIRIEESLEGEAGAQATAPAPHSSFLPHIPNAFDQEHLGKQWANSAGHGFGVGNSNGRVERGGGDYVAGVLGAGHGLQDATSGNMGMGIGGAREGRAAYPAPQNVWGAGSLLTSGLTAGENTMTMTADPPAVATVPTNSKGVPLELVPVHSEFLKGILNFGKDVQATLEAGAPPPLNTAPTHPLLVTLLVSAKPLWKTAASQQFDPNLFLTLFPPPPDKIVLSLLDVVGMYSGMGVMHEGKNTVNNSTATLIINVREWTCFLYELVNRYNDDYVTTPGQEGSTVPHVSRVFEPSSLEWWRRYARYVLVVRSKPNGQMLAKISRKLVDRLVQTLLINNSAPNVGANDAYDGVTGTGAGTNTHNNPDAPFQDGTSLRIHASLVIHTWDFSHVRPVDATAVIHQISWGNLYGLSAATVTDAAKDAKTQAPAPSAPAHIEEKTAKVNGKKAFTADMQFTPDAAEGAPAPAANGEESPPDSPQLDLDPESNSNVVVIPMDGGGVTYEDPTEALSSSSVVSEASKKKKKPKKKPPVNSIPDELLERNARFEIQHMMNFSGDEKSVVSAASGISAKHVLSQQVHKATRKTKPSAKDRDQSPPMQRSHTSPGDVQAHCSGRPHSHTQGEHVPAGTPSPDHMKHGEAHEIHTLAGADQYSSDGVIIAHTHHDVSVVKRMNSPQAQYRVVPNRSTSPGYYGNESQKSKEGKFVGGYWNDNCDVQYQKTPSLRSTAVGNVAVKAEPRPELFLDEDEEEEKERKKKKKAAKEKARSLSPEEKPAGPRRVFLTQDEVARKTIIRAREVVSTSTKFRTRQLTEVEAGLFRSPFAIPLVTEKMRREADML